MCGLCVQHTFLDPTLEQLLKWLSHFLGMLEFLPMIIQYMHQTINLVCFAKIRPELNMAC
jgi:hypothetical protein